MQEKRYQIFISSTFTDLQEERRAVQDAIISMGDFPVQMESFPATDQPQMQFIAPLIEQSDYYVLIIGGRYGTTNETGLSFTHQEFRYAVEKGVPVIVLPHGNPNNISFGKTERTDEGRAKLKEFIAEAERDRIRKVWETTAELKLAVRESLDNAKRVRPRVGWVRGDSVASVTALEELNEVRKENERFRETIGNIDLKIPLPKMPEVHEETNLTILPVTLNSRYGNQRKGSRAEIICSWIGIFPYFYSNLKYRSGDWDGNEYHYIDAEKSCEAIGSVLAGEICRDDTEGLFKLSVSSFERLIAYFTEAGLVQPTNDGPTPFTEAAQRIARRHYINSSPSSIVVSSGKITVTELESIEADDIPF